MKRKVGEKNKILNKFYQLFSGTLRKVVFEILLKIENKPVEIRNFNPKRKKVAYASSM